MWILEGTPGDFDGRVGHLFTLKATNEYLPVFFDKQSSDSELQENCLPPRPCTDIFISMVYTFRLILGMNLSVSTRVHRASAGKRFAL